MENNTNIPLIFFTGVVLLGIFLYIWEVSSPLREKRVLYYDGVIQTKNIVLQNNVIPRTIIRNSTNTQDSIVLNVKTKIIYAY